MLSDFTATANAIAATPKRGEKERLLGAFLVALDDSSLERAAVFFTGAPFPRRDQRVAGVGWSTIAEAFAEASGRPVEALWEVYPKHSDLGDAIAEIFPAVERDISLVELGEWFDRLAATSGSIATTDLLAGLLRRVDAQGARYVVKILLNEVRIGLHEGTVLSSIAKAFGRDLVSVRKAAMLTGDIGATALLARGDALESAKLALFQPFEFMLAQPEEDPLEIVAALGNGALADDKYDGIRAQVHSDGNQVRIFSRTLDDVTHRFPEVAEAAACLQRPFILDGEIVAFRDFVLPFAVIQKRLGRSTIGAKLLAEAPVVFFAFDLLHLDGLTLFESALRERLARLRELLPDGASAVVRRSVQHPVRDAAHVDELFEAARARANEGLVLKDPESIYAPGRRGKSWLKYKKALATLDCVVTAAQWGNGKRRGVLSDLTFAVWREGELVNIGKAYTGLTDDEIAATTERLQASTIARHGPVHVVTPTIVVEIAFDRIQESKRHKAGFALRFPRIVRLRDDKGVEQISTIDEVRRIYEGQLRREAPQGD